MKKFVRRFLSALLMLFMVLLASPAGRAEAGSDAPAPLSFGSDGTFTIMLLSDLQSTQFVSPHLLRALKGVLLNNTPDLIILLGDQLEGGSPVMRLGSDERNMDNALSQMMQPIAASGVPFAVLLGNHDHEFPVDAQTQFDWYSRYGTYIGSPTVAPGAEQNEGSYVQSLPVYASDGSGDVKLNLYLFDCGRNLPDGGYGAISRASVDWYNAESARLKEENGGQAVPGAAFSHVVLPEVYELFDVVSSGAAGAMQGVGLAAGRFYLPNGKRIFLGEVNEAPCPSTENNGLFDAFIGNDDVFLSVSGHDHVNSFIGAVRGVDMASAPGATFTSYNTRETRGVRLFRFREDIVRDYDTTFVPFSDFDGAEGIGAISYWLTTTTGAFYRPYKTILVVLVLGVIFFFLLRALFQLDSNDHKLPDMPEEDDDYDQPEDDWV